MIRGKFAMEKAENDLSKFAKNLRYYTNEYKQSPEELAAAVKVDTSTIYKYMQGKRKPTASNLIKLAKYYNVTAETLFAGKCWSSEQLLINYDNRIAMKELGKKAFPIFEPSKEALQDSDFLRGYKAQIRLYTAFAENGKYDKRDVKQCYDCYLNSIEKSQTIEAVANLLWLYIQKRYSDVHGERVRKMAEYGIFDCQKNVNTKFFVLNELLPDFIDINGEYTKELDESWEEECDALIRILKRYEYSSEYADFYVAIQYLYNLVNNEFEQSLNCMIGAEMMKKLYMIENKYAKEYALTLAEICE